MAVKRLEVENHRQGLAWRIGCCPIAIEIFADDPLDSIRFTRPLKGSKGLLFRRTEAKNDREGMAGSIRRSTSVEFVPLERDTEDLDFRHGL